MLHLWSGCLGAPCFCQDRPRFASAARAALHHPHGVPTPCCITRTVSQHRAASPARCPNAVLHHPHGALRHAPMSVHVFTAYRTRRGRACALCASCPTPPAWWARLQQPCECDPAELLVSIGVCIGVCIGVHETAAPAAAANTARTGCAPCAPTSQPLLVVQASKPTRRACPPPHAVAQVPGRQSRRRRRRPGAAAV